MHKFNHNIHGHSGRPDPKNIVAYEVALKGKKQIAEDTYSFIFEKPKDFNFRAGQHVRMTLLNPSETDAKGNSRFLTMASTPQEKDLVVAMRMTDSAFKKVLGDMQIGEKVKIEMRLDNPHGSFTLHDDTSKPAVFLVGGIGIVPAFSMIKDATERKLPHKLVLFYSNRRPKDAPYLEELQNLTKLRPNFKLIPTMTEPEKSARSWSGETGEINRSMLEKYLNNLQSPIYYISGLSPMVKAIKSMIIELGVSKDNIKAEEFDGFTMSHNDNITQPLWKRHLPLIAIALVVIVVVVIHVGAATSIFHNGFSFSNPLFYLMLGLMLLVLPFKFKHIVSFIQSRRKIND